MLYIVSRIDNIFQNVQNAIAEVETRIPKTDPKYNDAIEAAKEERFKKEYKKTSDICRFLAKITMISLMLLFRPMLLRLR
ncbi:MAG TPA: hypothetical protein DEO87_04730 [Lachnospiraceae bacterium]|nr:hypothetical protein [Lachnospiraceae bacterium]